MQYKRFLPLLLWCALIFYLSHQPAISVAESKPIDIGVHKLAHLIEYAILYLTFHIAFNPVLKSKTYVYGLIFATLYAISDEIHQSFVPSRSPRWYDVLVDICGAACGIVVTNLKNRKA